MKRIKQCLALCLCACLLLSFSNTTVNAVVQNDVVAVIPVEQQAANWCWAACGEMVGVNANPATTRTQVDIVRHIYGGLINLAGSAEQAASGASFAAINRTYYVDSAWSFSEIVTSLRRGFAIIAGCVRGNFGHMVVVYGTQFVDNSSGIGYYVDYIDPFDGSRNHCDYTMFCNGTYMGYTYWETVYTV